MLLLKLLQSIAIIEKIKLTYQKRFLGIFQIFAFNSLNSLEWENLTLREKIESVLKKWLNL